MATTTHFFWKGRVVVGETKVRFSYHRAWRLVNRGHVTFDSASSRFRPTKSRTRIST